MTTPRLALPEIVESQAGKFLTHNEALRVLDALVQLTVEDRDLTAPPGSPADGECWIVGATATGAWEGHDGEIAQRYAGAWYFIAPFEGVRAWVADEQMLVVYTGGDWDDLAGVTP